MMLVRRVVSTVTQRQVKHVAPVSPVAAEGQVATVYDQSADAMKIVIPPILLHSPSPPALAGFWMLMREPLIASGSVTRLAKETVAAAVSVANRCPYCVDMHSTGMYDLATEQDAEAVAEDRLSEVADPFLRDLADWARMSHLPETEQVRRPPFPAESRPELVGVAVAFHYLNRMVNIFLTNFLLPESLSPRSRRMLKQRISRMLGPLLRRPAESGLSLPLLPEAPLPPEAAWAAGHPVIAEAVARSYAAFEAAGARSLPAGARDLVLRRLSTWRGEETGISRAWCEELVAELPPAERAAGRLALLAALASYQVDDAVVGEFRAGHADDRTLVEAAAWASYAAARHVGSWHNPPEPAGEPGASEAPAGHPAR
jgi:alkylhydroperoxidase family enzyme